MKPSSRSSKSDTPGTRIDCRVSKRNKTEWNKIAEDMGMSFTAFVVASLNEATDRYKQDRMNLVHLKLEEQKKFFDVLMNPPKPNAALVQGFGDHNRLTGS